MPAETLKRNTAYKLKIRDILVGKPVLNEERFSFLDLGDKRIVRVNVAGNIVDKYDNEGEKRYSFLTIDDGSGQIKLKAFGDDSEKIKSLSQGQSIIIIGVLRYFNNEIYISPEITKIIQPEYLLVRKLELEKDKSLKTFSDQPIEREKIIAVKDALLTMIKTSEQNGGADVEEIILKPEFKAVSPGIINQEIKKMLEEGIIFEPRPGKVRWLG